MADETGELTTGLGLLNEEDGKATPSVFLLGKEAAVYWSYRGINAADRPEIDEVFANLSRVIGQYQEKKE